ncbi:MAG: hypothetical protein A2X86_10895 [Bdellovibrionales bacterium GWA2_49_15]|nr:MAG: hypothetical protein A2X86_10895 [Bdellovibrionales bacterium GWA2_49_15]HAZ11483.1 hypothetical protein [Bdellovibrionales bacterium]
MITALYSEFKSSIKSPDTEEKLDLVLYRPFGFLIAKISKVFSLTPTMLSIFGLICGLVSSYFFLQTDNTAALIWASFYLVLSGIFDSADGQLARMTNQSTRIGLVLDGICDSLVMIMVYAACTLPYLSEHGFIFLPVACTAIYLHSYQCAILDFYHREYLYFGYGKISDDTYWNPSVRDCQRLINHAEAWPERLIHTLHMTWIKKQQQLTTRTDLQRINMRKYLLSCDEERKIFFMKAYRRHNLWLLPYWRLIGVNAHTFLIIIFMLFRSFDLYLIVFDLILFNVLIFVIGRMQKNSDEQFLLELYVSDYANGI